MLTLLIYIVIVLIVAGVITWVVSSLVPISPPQIKTLIIALVWIIAAIFIIYWLISFAGGLPPPVHGRI